MTVNYGAKPGVDIPSWQWLNQFVQGNSFHGTSHAWDGNRHIYWLIQFGSSGGNSTTQIWRFDTWTNAWQYLYTTANGSYGADLSYDQQHNVLWIIIGNGSSSWYCFNCSPTTSVTIGSVVTNLAPMTLSGALAVNLPVAANSGAGIEYPTDQEVLPELILDGAGDQASTTTAANTDALTITDSTAEFAAHLIGCHVRFTSGTAANVGVSRPISSVTNASTLVLGAALPADVAAGDGYVIECPGNGSAGGLAVTSATTTTVVYAGGWVVNAYRDSDVVILTGTGAGQRRRIASNTATTLTLAATTTGNPRTGPFTTAPDATSTFAIVPSGDFLWYMPANGSTTIERVDQNASTTVFAAWTALPAGSSGGAYLVYAAKWAPFCMFVYRGSGTNGVYRAHIGLQTWTQVSAPWASENLNTGGTVTLMPYRANRFVVHVAGSQRLYIHNHITGELVPVTMSPYAAPGAYEGKRLRQIRTADGVDFLYMLRAGGQEFWRLPLTWAL